MSTQPTINANQTGSDTDWKLVWSDEFNGSKIDESRWRAETIDLDDNGQRDQANQHAVNTTGFNADGELTPGNYPFGKRHGVWYNKHHDKTMYIENNQLVLGGYVSDERDPTIKDSHHPYKDLVEGVDIDLRNKIYTSWVDTYALAYRDGDQRPNPSAPNQYWRGGYFEFAIDFTKMNTPGFRASAWLMPAVDPDAPTVGLVGKVYDNIAKNGLEIDLFEYEPSPGCEQLLLMKTIGGNGPSDQPVDASKFGFDLRKGTHVIGLLWRKDVLVWFLNGIEVNRDESHVPWVASAFYFTREGNTGIGSATANKPTSANPYIQHDPGLYGRNIGAYQDRINDDKVMIDYLRVWQDPAAADFNWISPEDVGVDGAEPTLVDVQMQNTSISDTTSNASETSSTGEYMAYDGDMLTWEPNDAKKWNVHIDGKYITTVHSPKIKATLSGEYSINEIIGKQIRDRSPGFYVDVSTPERVELAPVVRKVTTSPVTTVSTPQVATISDVDLDVGVDIERELAVISKAVDSIRSTI